MGYNKIYNQEIGNQVKLQYFMQCEALFHWKLKIRLKAQTHISYRVKGGVMVIKNFSLELIL